MNRLFVFFTVGMSALGVLALGTAVWALFVYDRSDIVLFGAVVLLGFAQLASFLARGRVRGGMREDPSPLRGEIAQLWEVVSHLDHRLTKALEAPDKAHSGTMERVLTELRGQVVVLQSTVASMSQGGSPSGEGGARPGKEEPLLPFSSSAPGAHRKEAGGVLGGQDHNSHASGTSFFSDSHKMPPLKANFSMGEKDPIQGRSASSKEAAHTHKERPRGELGSSDILPFRPNEASAALEEKGGKDAQTKEKCDISLYLEPVIDLSKGKASYYRSVLMVQDGDEVVRVTDSAEADFQGLRKSIEALKRLGEHGRSVGIICPLSGASFSARFFWDRLVRFLRLELSVCDRLVLGLSQKTLTGLSPEGISGLAALVELGCVFCLSDVDFVRQDWKALSDLRVQFLDVDGAIFEEATLGVRDISLVLRDIQEQKITLIASDICTKEQARAMVSSVALARGPFFALPRKVSHPVQEGVLSPVARAG